MVILIKDHYYDLYFYGAGQTSIEVFRDIKLGVLESVLNTIKEDFISFHHEGVKIILPTKRIYKIEQTRICNNCHHTVCEGSIHKDCNINEKEEFCG
jgi:hypothetical protein